MAIHRLVRCLLCLGMASLWGMAPLVVRAALPGGAVVNGQRPAWTVLVSAATVPNLPVNSAVRLSRPEGLAIDRRGRSANKWMYLADTGNDRILKLGTGGRYLGTWGRRGSGPGQFRAPAGVAVDGHGDVYVADTGNNRVQKLGPQGRFLTQWGTKGSGPGQFDVPSAVAVGGSGNVFVADRANKRVEKFSPSGQLLAVWPVFLPAAPNPPGFGPAGPYLLTVDAAGNVHVAVDTGQCSGGHCVMDYIVLETLSPSGKIIRSVVGGNPYGTYSYQPVPGMTGQGSWWQIGALAVDRHNHLFAAVWSPENQATVTELSATAKPLGQWELPQPSGARGWPPQGIAVDPRGNVYVADTLANRVLRLAFRR